MPRLIDADALVKDFNICFGGVSHAVIAKNLIDNAPTIDAEPVRHGRWQKTVDCWMECSACGDEWNGNVVPIEDFHCCPNCGCKMDLEG